MPYATEADLAEQAGGVARLDESIPPDNPAADPDNRGYWIARALTRGDDEINAYLPPRYATPLTAPSPYIVRLAAEAALYWLRSIGQNRLTEDDVARKEFRLQELRRIREGKLWPGDSPPAATSGRRSTTVASSSKWSLSRLRRYG